MAASSSACDLFRPDDLTVALYEWNDLVVGTDLISCKAKLSRTFHFHERLVCCRKKKNVILSYIVLLGDTI